MSSLPAGSKPISQPSASGTIPEVEILDHYEDRSRWSTFHRLRYRVRRADGEWIAQGREFLDRGDAIALLPFCPETGNLLLTRQFRMPVYLKRPEESMLLEVCGGILDDPDPAVTLRHEAVDELGLELNGFEKVFEGYSTPGSVCEKVHFYIATYIEEQLKHAGGGLVHEGEAIEVLEMPHGQAMRLVRSGEIRDLRSIALILYLATIPPFAPSTISS